MKMIFLLVFICLGAACQDHNKKNSAQIEKLNKQWEANEKQALQAEVRSEGDMLSNYSKFAEELKISEEADEKADFLQSEMNRLQKNQ